MSEITASPMPRYHQVYLILRQKILEGVWPAGSPMPSEHELALAHDVSRITVRNALGRLQGEGLISRRRGSGTFVEPLKLTQRRENLKGLLENLLAMGLRTEVRLLSFAYIPAPPDVAQQLEIRTGAIVQKSVRVRLSDGTPFSHLTAWVPEDIGRHYRPEDLAERPLLALLHEVGFPPADAEQIISCKLADNVITGLLNVEPASALLWVRRQVRSEKRPIEYIEALYRPDLYEYKIDLVRQGDVWSHLGTAAAS